MGKSVRGRLTVFFLEDVRIRPSLARQGHPRARAHEADVLARLAHGSVAFARRLDEPRRPLRAAVAVLAANLELALHTRVGIAVSHRLARRVTVDALHAGFEVNVCGNVRERALLAAIHRPRQPSPRRNERVVAVHEPLICESGPAAPVVAARAGLHRRQPLKRMRGAVRAPAAHRLVAPPIGRALAVRKMAGRAARGMAGLGGIVVRHAEVTAGAELAVELTREVVEARDRSDRDLGAVGTKPAPVLRAEDDASPLALPGGLDLPDNSRVRKHLAARHPVDLIAMAGAARELPTVGARGIAAPVHSPVRRHPGGRGRVAPVARDTAGMRSGGDLETAVAIDAPLSSGPRPAAPGEQPREDQKEDEGASHIATAAQPGGPGGGPGAEPSLHCGPSVTAASATGSRCRSQASCSVFISLHHLK